MAYQKLQAERALKVIPSDTINIPNIAGPSVSGTTTSTTANKLVDSTASFTSNLLGYIVYSGTQIATVTAVDDANTLSLSADIMISGEAYTLYADDNNGCVLQTGLAGTIRVLTIGGDDVTFSVVAGAFVPVQVKRVLESTTMFPNDIIALW
jgi:hypothetical protein